MKYMFLSIAALAVVFGLSFLTAGLIRRKLKKKPRMAVHVIICVLISFAVMLAGGFIFLNIHYSAEERAVEAFSKQGGVKVTEIDGGYFIDGKGDKTALIFYPGAKVDSEAYMPLMEKIADSGVDCFLLKMPMRIAILDSNAADKIIENYNYDKWILSGHSMGGMIAASYCAEHENVDGAALLAAYPIKKIPDGKAVLSVYGTEDKVLNSEAYKKAAELFPKDFTEVVIEGGNHARFGNYGEQSGDGKATISSEEQQKQTANAVIKFAETIK